VRVATAGETIDARRAGRKARQADQPEHSTRHQIIEVQARSSNVVLSQ